MPGDQLFSLRFDVAGERQIDSLLSFAIDAVSDWGPAFDKIHDDFTDRIMPEQFDTEGARGPSGAWDRYTGEPKYKARKAGILDADPDTMPILRWTPQRTRASQPGEKLYPSLVDQGDTNHVWRKSRFTFEVGTQIDYADEHQTGGGFQPFDDVAIPRRKIIDLLPDDRERWVKLLQAHWATAISAEGRQRLFL